MKKKIIKKSMNTEILKMGFVYKKLIDFIESSWNNPGNQNVIQD